MLEEAEGRTTCAASSTATLAIDSSAVVGGAVAGRDAPRMAWPSPRPQPSPDEQLEERGSETSSFESESAEADGNAASATAAILAAAAAEILPGGNAADNDFASWLAKQEQQVQEDSAKARSCRSCGRLLKSGASFCESCGQDALAGNGGDRSGAACGGEDAQRHPPKPLSKRAAGTEEELLVADFDGSDDAKESKSHGTLVGVENDALETKDDKAEDKDENIVELWASGDMEKAWWHEEVPRMEEEKLTGFHMPDNDPDEIIDLAEAKGSKMRYQEASPAAAAAPDGVKEERLNGDASCVKTASRRSRAGFSSMLGAAGARDAVG